MTETVTSLITDAYHTSGIVSKEFETVSGRELNDGLSVLNALLQDKTVDNGMIPYYQQFDFNASTGEEKYFIENLIDIETLVFFIDNVRYKTNKRRRKEYFGSSRSADTTSLPFDWHMERTLGGADIYLYFLPDQNYPITIFGQFRLIDVVLNQDLELTLDRFYINYLKYDLANRLCIEYNYSIPPGVAKQHAIYINWIKKQSSPMDLSMRKKSSLTRKSYGAWGQINYGRGWRVP